MATTVKAAAIQWLNSKFGKSHNTVHASKLHASQSVWWIDIPKTDIETPISAEIDLLCQAASNSDKFYYFKVPTEFFKKEKLKFEVNGNGIFRLHLSAEPDTLFVEQRGSGKIRFSRFLITR